MMYQPPTGVRDLLPLDVTQQQWIEERVQRVFGRWGYHRIITPTLERLETLGASGTVNLDTILQLRDAEGTPLGLRPDLTPSIARAVATRLLESPWPARLSYLANVFRSTAQPHEFTQAGVELLGASGPLADAEVLLLLADVLNELEVPGWKLILGAAGFTRSLLAQVPETLRTRMRAALATLDRVTILRAAYLPAEVRTWLLRLFDLRGEPDQVLAEAASLPLVDPQQHADLATLKLLTDWLAERQVPVVLDLSLVETFDYYTGIVFEVSAANRVLGQGGRYDQLLGFYGRPAAGAGFALNLEALQRVLLPAGRLPESLHFGGWLVVPETAAAWSQALQWAEKLRREQAPSVQVELLGRTESQVQEYARQCGIARILWVQGSGATTTEEI